MTSIELIYFLHFLFGISEVWAMSSNSKFSSFPLQEFFPLRCAGGKGRSWKWWLSRDSRRRRRRRHQLGACRRCLPLATTGKKYGPSFHTASQSREGKNEVEGHAFIAGGRRNAKRKPRGDVKRGKGGRGSISGLLYWAGAPGAVCGVEKRAFRFFSPF